MFLPFVGCSNNPSQTSDTNNLSSYIGKANSNWSLYSGSSFWNTDITNTAFVNDWTQADLINVINNIGESTWSSAIAYLQSSAFTSQLPTITSYTCYDRKQVDQFDRSTNQNCAELSNPTVAPQGSLCALPSDATKTWACSVYGKITCTTSGGCTTAKVPWTNNVAPNTATCCIYEEGGVLKTTGTCAIQDETQEKDGIAPVASGPVVDSCQLDGAGPSPDAKHINGFYCSSWNTTTIDLTKVNLQLNNLYNGNQLMGCMSPSTAVSASTQWGGLGIGTTCTKEDPSVVNSGLYILEPTYLDAAIMYANPYNNDQISGLNPLTPSQLGPSADDGQYQTLKAFNAFCAKYSDFCRANAYGGASTPGLAHIVGQMGPISLSEYVAVLQQSNPKGYYTWQYDDAAGTTVCNSKNSKVIAYFCEGDQLSPTAAQAVFSGSSHPDSRFAAVNNCEENIWVQMKPSSYNTCSGTSSLGTDCLVSIPQGGSYVYNTPAKGLQSVNIWSKTGCDATGYNCTTGDIYVAKGNLGPQPDMETKVEATFGCTLTPTTGCQTAPNGKPLASPNYYDVSFVDGYTRPVWLQVLPATDETNSSCVVQAAPVLDVTTCPISTDLSTVPKS